MDMGQPHRPTRLVWKKVLTRPFRFLLLATGAALSGVGWATPSFAQGTPATPAASPVQPGPGAPQLGPVGPPPTAPEELGITLGSFRLYPTLDLRAGYDTNVFAQPASQQTGSAYEAIRPQLDLRSDWNNHMLNFGAYGVF